PVWLSAYWLSETPVSWADYCRLMQWQGPPAGVPDGEAAGDLFLLHNENKIRRQYCGTRIGEEDGDQTSTRSIAPGGAGTPEWRFDLKPMVSAGWQQAEDLCARLSGRAARYALPTEAQW